MTDRTASNYLEKEFFNLTLAVLGIIQGLSLNQIAAKFSSGKEAVIQSNNLLGYLAFIMCFLLILRVFQTYLLAALDYSGWKASILEIFTIFFVGIIEFWVFDVLASFEKMDFRQLSLRVSILFLIASTSHFVALIRVRRGDIGADKTVIKRETIIQTFNVVLPLLAFSICIFTLYLDFSREIHYITYAIISCIVVINITTSLSLTMVENNVQDDSVAVKNSENGENI